MFFARKIKSLLLLLIPAIVLLQVNSAINGHYHSLSDGMIIYHAHPYTPINNNNFPFQKHKHSKTEYALLQIISHFISLGGGFEQIYLFLLIPKKRIKYFFNYLFYLSYNKDNKSYRAPPAVC